MSDDGDADDAEQPLEDVVRSLAETQQALAEQQRDIMQRQERILEKLAEQEGYADEFAEQFADEFREYLPGTEDADGEHTDDADREPGRMFQ